MTCNCKAELASILREESRLWNEANPNDPFHIGISRAFATLAARLAPATEEQKPEEPLEGWRAKCNLQQDSEREWFIYGPKGIEQRLCVDGWQGCGPAIMRFPTRDAALAALRAAAPPPGVEDKSAAFDAEKWAENMVPTGPKGGGFNAQGTIRVHNFPDAKYSWNPFGVWPDSDRRYIKEALEAAYAAGLASQARERLRYEVRGNLSGEVFASFKFKHEADRALGAGIVHGKIIDTQPPAPTEAPR